MENIITYNNPKSVISESIKILRTNLLFSAVDNGLKTLMITSSVAGEGKSFITSNLAVAFASLDKKVLVVDCDMKRGTQHKLFKLSNTNGMSDLLIDTTADYKNYIKKTEISNLNVITFGSCPPNSSELLNSKSFEKFVKYARENFDIVLFDAPPTTMVSDACIIATNVDKTIIITRAKMTTLDDLEKTKKMLESVNAKIAGVVFNGSKISQKKYYGSYYK